MKHLTKLAGVVVLTGIHFVTAAQNLSGSGYRSEEARKPERLCYATVVATRVVQLDKTTSGNSAVGAGIGGIAGAMIGNRHAGNDKGATTAIGALAGAAIGNSLGSAIENKNKVTKAIDVIVRMDAEANGATCKPGTFKFTQEADSYELVSDQKVYVTESARGVWRVFPL